MKMIVLLFIHTNNILIKDKMNIIYFGNRNYWDIEKTGHTRYEHIFKTIWEILL